MRYHDLRDFIAQLEKQGELKRISLEVSPHLEMTEICDRVLKQGGPAILFEKPTGHTIPVLANLFGTPKRVAMGMGEESVDALREVGKLLAYLKEPDPPRGLKDAWDKLPVLKKGPGHGAEGAAAARRARRSCGRAINVDLGRLPIQTCWPGDAGPLDHLGADGHARTEQDAAKSGHLSPAGDCAATKSSCAGFRIEAARSTSAIIVWSSRMNRSRSRLRWAPIQQRSWAR